MPLTRVSLRKKSVLQENFMRKKCKFLLKGKHYCNKNCLLFFRTLRDFCLANTPSMILFYLSFISKRAFQAFNSKLLTFDNGNSLMTEQFSLRNQCCIYLIYRNSALTKMYLKGICVLYTLFV